MSTASLQYDIIRPVRDKELIVKGRIIRKGRRIVFAEAEMTNHEGVVLARGTQTAVPI
jgi:acyl-coenzyme A thioesterase PaaI-like protein